MLYPWYHRFVGMHGNKRSANAKRRCDCSVFTVQMSALHFRPDRVTFEEYFRWKGIIPSNPRWSGKTRGIPVLYSVEISTDNYFVLSQYLHLTGGQIDRIVTAIPCVALDAVTQ